MHLHTYVIKIGEMKIYNHLIVSNSYVLNSINSKIFDLWHVFCQLISVVYRSIYYFENLCIQYNYVIDIYIMGVLLKYNHFWVDVTKIT